MEIWPKLALRKEGGLRLAGDHTAQAGTIHHGCISSINTDPARARGEVRGEREKSISICCADVFHLCSSDFSHFQEGLEGARGASVQGSSSLPQISFEVLSASSHIHLCPLKGEPHDLRSKFKSQFSPSLAVIDIEGCKEMSCSH